MESQNQINCRLCDKNIIGKNGLLLYDYNENVETQLGRKINIILNSTEKSQNLSNYCCNFCSSKIEICFSLLVEIQASDEVIRQTYENLVDGKKIDTATQLFICGECKTTISGIKLFIKHYENHILKKTTVGSIKDVTATIPDHNKRESEVQTNDSTEFSDFKSAAYESVKYDNLDYTLKNLVENISNNNDSTKIQNFKKNHSKKVISAYNLNDSKVDEYNNYDDNNSLASSDLTMQTLDLKNNEIFNFNAANLSSINQEVDDSDDSDALSLNSFTSDSSYKDLIEVVKKELEKSDSEDSVVEPPNEDGFFYCSTCKLSFQYKFILKLHLKKNHEAFQDLDIAYIKKITKSFEEEENDVVIKCGYCKKEFLSSEQKSHTFECVHNNLKTKNILCQFCGRMSGSKSLEKHMEEHNKLDNLTCELCGKKFRTKRFLKSHLGEHDESRKKMCEFCGQKVLPLSFFSHVMKHREKRHVCQYCGKAFSYNYGLRIHLKVHDSKKLELKSLKKKDKIFCWLCKKDFDCSVSLNKHLKHDHNAKGLEQDLRFSCSQCDKKFADMFSLKVHLKLIHEMKDEEISRLKSLPVYRYIECNVCNKIFNSENKIRVHMKQDHGLKPFEMEILKKECEKCGKKFASKQNLIHHINGAHLHIKPMTCDICQEKFAKHSSLIYHKLRHSGEKPFQCEFCQKSYRQRNDVIRHLARHVRDKELTLEEASAVNNSPSRLVIKRRIFLKDSSINYQTIVRKSRRKSEVVEMDPILEEEINDIQEEQMEFNENGMSESLIYVEEVPLGENHSQNSSDVQYINSKSIFNEERNTIILSSSEALKNSVKSVSYRYIPSQLKHMPAVIVKKEEQF